MTNEQRIHWRRALRASCESDRNNVTDTGAEQRLPTLNQPGILMPVTRVYRPPSAQRID